jgi:uncharacterized protein with GYD domain
MFFISIFKWKKAPKKEELAEVSKAREELEKQGIKIQMYWTLGRYDAVIIIEASTEKDAMRSLLP